MTAHTRALEIPERLAPTDPNNTLYQRNLLSLDRLGALREARGDHESALKAYTRSVQIAEQLARTNPDNTDYQNNRAVVRYRVADVRRGRGDHQAALWPTPAP